MADCIQSTPIVQSRPASKEYCDGWERVFGRKPCERCGIIHADKVSCDEAARICKAVEALGGPFKGMP